MNSGGDPATTGLATGGIKPVDYPDTPDPRDRLHGEQLFCVNMLVCSEPAVVVGSVVTQCVRANSIWIWALSAFGR